MKNRDIIMTFSSKSIDKPMILCYNTNVMRGKQSIKDVDKGATTMPEPTMKKINNYLKELAPLELVKGNGYFYFIETKDAKFNWQDVPDSIGVCHMNHLSMEQWQGEIDYAVDQWNGSYSTRSPFFGN